MRNTALFIFLAGCSFEAHCGGGKDTIKQQEAESNIADGLRQQGLTTTAVHCATADVAPEVGKTFICEVTLDDGKTYGWKATIDRRDGDSLHFQLEPVEANTVNTRKLAAMLVDTLGKELGVEVTADCHDALKPVPDSRVLACDMVLGGFAHTVEAHLDDQMNVKNVTYDGLVERKTLEDAFHHANPTATVDCGKDPLVKADGLPCQVAGGPAVTTHAAANGDLSWTRN